MRPVLCVLGGVFAATLAVVPAGARAEKADATPIPYEDAKPILEANGRNIAAADWPTWVATRNAEIRARLAQGDEDSIVNLWLYGTSFTKLPRVTDREAMQLKSPEKVQDLLLARLDDFVAAIARPGTNERLLFARDLVTKKRITPATEAGRSKAREYLIGLRERVIADNERYRRAAASPSEYSTLFRDRGLSSDTRLTASFAIDKALEALAASGRAPADGIKRIAIVGPGLDFTDKAEGYDFYPPQTIQPFAIVDSLVRLKLSAGPACAACGGLDVTTLDLSPRVNRHLEAARRRAAAGASYVIQLPLAKDEPKHEWQPDFASYWQRFGAAIGKAVPAAPVPAVAGDVRVRAVAIRPSIVSAITARDLNIILERTDDEPFDLIVATNILVYYDAFEQSLALANITRMLKPGGFLLTNYAVSPMPPMETTASLKTAVFFDRQGNGDTVFGYQNRQSALRPGTPYRAAGTSPLQ
jgi:hypothetical protein